MMYWGVLFALLCYPCVHLYLYPRVSYRRLEFGCKMCYIRYHVRLSALLSVLCLWLLGGVGLCTSMELLLSVCVSELFMCNNSFCGGVCLWLTVCLLVYIRNMFDCR